MVDSADGIMQELATLPAYLLCGGQSRRFGSDKARIEINGTPLLLHLARQLAEFCSDVKAVADRPEKYADVQIPTIVDHYAGIGPLGGLHAALQDWAQKHTHEKRGTPWLVLASCDQTLIQPHWLLALLQAGQQQSQALAVVYREAIPLNAPLAKRRFQPFPGIYHQALIPRLVQQIHSREFSFQQLLSSLAAEELVTLTLPSDWPSVPQINTPEDMLHWKQERSV